MVEVREVKSRRDLDRFAKMPWPIYDGDPHWVPPLLLEVKEFLNRKKHPFYRHGDATALVALRGGRAVGRILVSDDPNYNQLHDTNVGCFGMFESIEDQNVADALLNAAADWLSARGRDSMMGPIDYSTNYPCGLLIDGFDTPPTIMMNHNRPYYGGMLEAWGLAKVKDLYSWWFTDPKNMVEKWHRRAQRLAQRGGVTIRPVNPNDFETEVARCVSVYNDGLADNWGFVKLSEPEFLYMAKQIARIAKPDLILLAEVGDKPVGFSVTLPNINEAIQPLNGRLTTFGVPLGLARLVCRTKRIKTARMLILDILQEYRRRGISELLILYTLNHGKNTIGYTGAELGWTLEDNYLINRTVEAVGAKHYKTYRIYEKTLGRWRERMIKVQ
ncbi:MAG: N-acetyltransferase [Planctomycetota bacterium]|nr:N-acetyltransferase [Planctomycetota bacterium]